MGNPLDIFSRGGGGNGSHLERQRIPFTNDERRGMFLQNFYNAFGGGGNAPQQFGNSNLRNAVSGYFEAPFQDVAHQLSQVNTFVPRPKPQNFRLVAKPNKPNGMMSGMGGFMPQMPQFPMMPGSGGFMPFGDLF